MFGRMINGGLGFTCVLISGCIMAATIPTMSFVMGAFAVGAIAGAISANNGESSEEFNESIQQGIKSNLSNDSVTHIKKPNPNYNPIVHSNYRDPGFLASSLK